MTTLNSGESFDDYVSRWYDDMVSHFESSQAKAASPVGEPAPTKPRPTIKPFDTAGVAPCVVQAYNACREWLSDIIRRRRRPHMLSLLGCSGCGKTHLARNTKAALLSHGISCTMRTWAQILTDMRTGDAAYIIHSLCQPRVLILDDVGAENLGSEWAHDNSTSLLGEVLDGRVGKWTMITSNFLTGQFAENYDARIASRIHRDNAVIIQMPDAADYALAEFKKRS